MNARREAISYYRRGWCPIPIKTRSKKPNLEELKPYLSRAATEEELSSWTWPGVGLVTGQVSGLLVLDADNPQGEAVLKEHGHPVTPMVRTARGGLHAYFKHPDVEIRTGIRVAKGLDLKAAGGYILAPPSIGPNGQSYEWIISPEEVDLADPPAWVMKLLEQPRRNGTAGPVGERIPSGQRNQELASIAGSMRRRGMDEVEISAALTTINKRRCDPPLEEDEVGRIARSVAQYEPAKSGPPPSGNGRDTAGAFGRFNLTELGNAERFVAHHGEAVHYCYPWGKWLVWTGARWEPDTSGRVHQLAKGTVRGIYQEAAAAEDEDRRKALAQHATRSESEAKIKAMLELAKSEVPVATEDLDSDPWLLNCLNGTVDLQSGELRPHRREDLITKLAPVEYDPGAEAPNWQATLERVLSNPEIRAFFKRVCGYAITGDTSEHVLPMLFGTGANGKSTVLNALLEALGGYAMQSAPDLLIAKRNSHPTELADLFGARLVASIEVEDGRRLAESLVKQLTGGDRVKARRMRQDFWEFSPTHKVFMAVNHKPIVRGTDTAIWRRIRLIPFTETIPPQEQDKRLPEKLKEELPGILAWAVEGCLEWQREGLQAPEEVRKATGEYRSEMDVLGAFLKECCRRDPAATVGAQDLYKAYQMWAEESGERSEGKRKFSTQLKERGFESRRSGPNGSYEWQELQLLNFWKAAICRKTELTEAKMPINGSENDPRGVIGKKGSEGSVSSVDEHKCKHGTAGGCHLCKAEIASLVEQGTAERFAREEVFGKEEGAP